MKSCTEAAPLTAHLRWFASCLVLDEDSTTSKRIFKWFAGSKVMLLMMVFTFLTSVADTYLCHSETAGRLSARFSLGVWSCLWSQHTCLNRAHLVHHCLISLSEITEQVECKEKHTTSLKRMEHTARQSSRLIRFYTAYATSTQLVTFVTFIAIEPRSHKVAVSGMLLAWDSVTGMNLKEMLLGELVSSMRWGVFLVQMLALAGCLCSYYATLSFIFVVFRTASDVYDLLGRVLEEQPCSSRWASLESHLLRVLIAMDRTITDILPHLLVVVVVLPLLSTVELVGNGMQADAYALGTGPLIMTVFVPLCFIGDDVHANRRAMARSAFRGPWLEENLDQRRLRLGFMLSALGRGAAVRGRGIGVLDRRTCGNALRSWFSFLQILINIQTKSDEQVPL